MAYELKAIFEVQDRMSAKVRKITQEINKLDIAFKRATASATQFNNTQNKQSSAVNRVSNSFRTYTTTINHNTSSIAHNTTIINNNAAAARRATSAFSGLKSTLLGLAGAYVGAQTAGSLFNSTIGAAAQYEQSSTVLKAMMNDAQKYQEYVGMIDKIAIDSPLLNSQDMVAGSKGLLTLTKDMNTLESSWKTISKLVALNPMQGVDGAVYSLKALQSGDVESIVDRFDMNRKDVNGLKGQSFENQIAGLDKILGKMNVTDKLVQEMGNTTLGQWNSMKERASVFFRTVGEESNSTIGKFLMRMNNLFDTKNSGAFAEMLGKGLNDGLTFAINLVEAIGKIRDTIDNAKAKVAEFKAMFSKGMDVVKSFIPPSVLADMESLKGKAGEISTYLKEKWAELQPAVDMLKMAFTNTVSTVSSVLSTLWGIAGPIFSLIGNALKIVGDVAVMVFNNLIAPMIMYTTKVFSIMWSVVGPILQLLFAALEVVGTVILWVWDSALKPFVDYISSGLVKALETVMPKLDAVGDTFSTIGGWIKTAADYVSNFASMLKQVKVPDWLSSMGGNAKKLVTKLIPGNYHGLSNVPYDGYTTRLHKNERVLTAQENKEYSEGKGGGGITIAKLADQIIVREDADIDRIALEIAKRIEREVSFI